MSLLTGTLDYSGFHRVDMVVEAVFEDLSLKHQMVKDVERECGEHTVFASNTSSLPIHQIASAAAHPERVVGLHYFSPVDKMPLAEIIPTPAPVPRRSPPPWPLPALRARPPSWSRTRRASTSTASWPLHERGGAPGAGRGAGGGAGRRPARFRLPGRPHHLAGRGGDRRGCQDPRSSKRAGGEQFQAPAAFDKLLQNDRKGRKNGKGFYLYGKAAPRSKLTGKEGKKTVDESVYGVLGISPQAKLAKAELAERCVLMMLNEAAMALDSGVVASARDGDIGAIFGIGFPPFLGGPFRYMDSLGIEHLVGRLEHYQKRYGDRFAPCDRLKAMAAEQLRFY